MDITPQNTALLVIDVNNIWCKKGFEVEEYNLHFSKIRQMAPKLARFIAEYKKKFNSLVVYVKCVKWDKDHVAQNLRELYKDSTVKYYPPDHDGTGTGFYLVKPEDGDVVITKNNYDAFSNPELDKLLKSKNIKYLIITGIFGDGCVHATIENGFSRGYNFIILKDLIETADRPIKQAHQKILKDYTWSKMFGKTITSKEFLENI